MVESLAGQLVRGYKLHEAIGAGGFGAVYRATQPAVAREVAVKIILPEYANNPEFIRRFESEAQMVARLEHLHIVPLYDYWREPDSAYLVMRYLRGGSARDILDKNGAWPLQDIFRLLKQITSALAVAHRHQIIHRDLKPDNILLDTSGNYFLADFGIAKDMSEGDVNKTGPIIGSPAYFSPEQIRGTEVTGRTDIYSLSVCIFELLTGTHPYSESSAQGMILNHLKEPFPDVTDIRPELPHALNQVIHRASAKNPLDRYPDVLMMSGAFGQAIGITPSGGNDAADGDETTLILQQRRGDQTPTFGTNIPEPENPYKGLRSFREADAEDFFGRETLVKNLIARLSNQRLLTVIGPSGSGKSSAVHAGLIPALRRAAITGSRNWFYVMMHPGEDPIEELGSALLRVAINPPGGLRSQLEENERGLLRALKRTLPDDNSELVLVIDQFEELFTLVEEEAVRQHFMDSLRVALADPRSRLRVIATLRADFYDRPLLYPEFGEIIRESTAVVLPLNRKELEQAITGPAERVGLIIEPQLVATMIKDVGATASALPLLQYALTELYERRDGRVLTMDAYREIGGVSGALARRAEEIFVELWEPTKKTARQIFLRLVNLGEGTEDTRRRVAQSELLSLNPDEVEDAVEYCLDQFGKYRLLTFDNDPQTREPTVEVAHEALIREWTRLRQWLDENRDDLRTQRKLSAAADEWLGAGQDPSFLARGTRLENFREWRSKTSLTMNENEEAFLAESIAADRTRAEAEAEQQRREEALEQRSRQRLRAFLALAAVAAIVASLLSIIAFSQGRAAQSNADALATAVVVAEGERLVAERNADEAQSLALAASAQQAFSASNNDLAIALALAANQLNNPPAQSQRVLAEAAYAPGTRRVFSGHTNFVQAVAFGPNSEVIASASADSTLRLWDAQTGETIQIFSGHNAAINDVAISSNAQQILSASADGTARLWDIATAEVIASIRPAEGRGILTAQFSPDGLSALLGDADGSAHIWRLNEAQDLQTFTGHDGPIYDTTFTPRGTTFLTASGDMDMRLWSVNTGSEVRRLLGHEASVYTVAIAPDGITTISGDADGTVRVWDVRFGQQIKQFFGHTDAVNAVAITSDSRLAVTGSEDGTVRVWDIETSEELLRFRGHNAPVTAIAISPDGRQVVSGARDNTMRSWDLQSGAEVRRMTDIEEVFIAAALSSDGAFVLSGGRNGGLATWDVATGDLIRTLSNTKGTVGALSAAQEETISTVALSPNDRLALSGTRVGSVAIWDVNSGTDLRRTRPHDGPVTAAAFMPDNRQVVTAGADGTLVRTDAGTGNMVYQVELDPNLGVVNRLRLLPDGEIMLAGTTSGILLLIDGADGSVLRRIGSHADAVLALDVSPDGTRALSGSRDASLRLWDLTAEAPNAQLLRLDGHDASVTGVSLADSLAYAVSGSADRSLILWDLALETPVQQLSGHDATINAVHYLPDNNFALSASADGTLRLWQTLELPALIEWAAQNRYSADFTCAQREQYRITPLCDASTG